MTNLEPAPSPELQPSKELLDDNARKFIVATIDNPVLEDVDKHYLLTTDWLEIGGDREKKLAYKRFPDGDAEILLITKVTTPDGRKSEKPPITQSEYDKLLAQTIKHVEKVRYEITYFQDDLEFELKYDEFDNSNLRVLEVDVKSKRDEDRLLFKPESFPGQLIEVTGDERYYGYRIADTLEN